MRFCRNGPNLPTELLEARDQGNVVFFCGAGVSRPAGLPGFLELARQAIEKLRAPPDAKSRTLLARAEADPDLATPLDQVFSLLQQEYTASEIEDVVSELLASPREANVAQHEVVLCLSRNAANQAQVVTTNFDLLFERAEKSILKHVPPGLPDLASGQQPTGIIYLHGRRSPKPTGGGVRQGLILSSADFGRAYLADGWATRFVRELLRNYVIVLLGYSANDPPVGYLLQGMHARGDTTSSPIYAFDQGSDEDVSHRWKDRGVRPLAYPVSDSSHSALWNSLRAWAERAHDPDAWRRTIVTMAHGGPRNLEAHERGQVASLVGTVAGAKLFAEVDPPPPAEWLCVFDRSTRYAEPRAPYGSEEPFDPLATYGLDDDLPRQPKSASRTTPTGIDLVGILPHDERADDRKRLAGWSALWADFLPARLGHLARWFGKTMNDPASAWWAANYHVLHPETLQQVALRLEQRTGVLDERAHLAWSLLLEKFRTATQGDRDHAWYEFASKLGRVGWTRTLFRELERVLKPRLETERAWSKPPHPPIGDWNQLTLRDVASWKVKFPNRDLKNVQVPTEHLPEVFRCARRALENASSLLTDLNENFWQTATFHPEQRAGNRHLSGADTYLLWFVALFDRLVGEHPIAARRDAQSWPSEDPYFFAKLSIYAWMKSALFSGTEAAKGLLSLSCGNFWEGHHRRELLHALRARWSDFSQSERAAVETRVVGGPPRSDHENETDFAERKAATSATMLGWLDLHGCELSAATRDSLAGLRGAAPHWQRSWDSDADDSREMRGGLVQVDSDPSRIVNIPLSQLVLKAEELTARDHAELTERRPFQGIVRQSPFRAVAALSLQGRLNNYPSAFWSDTMNHWPETTSQRLRWLFALRLARLPASTVTKLRHTLPSWLEKHLPLLAQSSRTRAFQIYDAVLDRLASCDHEVLRSGIISESVAGETQKRSRRTYEHAINAPTGRMTQLLLKMLDDLKLAGGDGLPSEFRLRLTRLWAMPGEGADHAICETTRHLRWLYYRDPKWVCEEVAPMFDLGHPFAEPAWNGYLHDDTLPPDELFALLKPHYVRLFPFPQLWHWDDGPIDRLHEFLVVATWWNRSAPFVSYAEAHALLQQTDDRGRSRAAGLLAHVIRDHKCWKTFGRPFIKDAWPREARYRTSAVSRQLAVMAEEAGNHFPDVVRIILPLLGPIDQLDLLVHKMKKLDGAEGTEIPAKFPEPALALLDRLIGNDPRRAPYDLNVALNMIANAAAHLRQDQRWKRLNHVANNR